MRAQEEAVKSPRLEELKILVLDTSGKPIPNVKVTPWALGSGQGHGIWGPFEGKPDESGTEPQEVSTDATGRVTVLYPFYRHAREKTRTLVVSVLVAHPEFAIADAVHIDVPAPEVPHKIVMTPAATLEVLPTVDGEVQNLKEIFALWSNSRSWDADYVPEKLTTGRLRLGGFLPGPNSLLLARMVGEQITHFSSITDVELQEGKVDRLSIKLKPAVRVNGKLSENVPRPVRNGRVVARTVASKSSSSVMWTDWAAIDADGHFTFDKWPAGEMLQIIALCDGFIATSGKAPTAELELENDAYHRPHAFDADDSNIEIPMMELVPVSVTVRDQENRPVRGLDVATSPNVGWWSFGSQIYALNLVHGRELIQKRDYRSAMESPFPSMFRGLTNSQGKVEFQLPNGRQYIELLSDVYELPIDLGRRANRPVVEQGKPMDLELRVQAVGTERLGDWDKLAGIVYGCSTIEGRRILGLPGMKEKMDSFVERFSDAQNQEDPALLAEAYQILANSFLEIGEKEEALKWRGKASEAREADQK